MSLFGNLNGPKIARGFGALIALAGLVITYLAFANSAGYWPFGDLATIEMNYPRDGSQIVGDFTVELSGNSPDSNLIWLAAKNSAQSWYPLAEAVQTSSGHWSATIRAKQITSPVLLCAVTVSEIDANKFRSFLQAGDTKKGLKVLPSGAKDVACSNIHPAKL